MLLALSPAVLSEPLEPRSADREALEQVIAEGRVNTSPSRPGPSLYVSDAGITVSAWLAEIVDRWLPGFGRLADWFLAAAWGLLLTVLIVVAAVIGVALARRWWADRSRSRPSVAATALPTQAAASRWPAERWEEEVRQRLAGGDVAAAVEALWWWLASVLVERHVDPSWTSRELLARAGRADLRPLIRRLDRMIYGPESPPAEDVRLLFRDLRETA